MHVLVSGFSSAYETGDSVLDAESSFCEASSDEVFGESSAFPAPEFWISAFEAIEYF
jgi:hypothetical protein